jgi:hypothetical protein
MQRRRYGIIPVAVSLSLAGALCAGPASPQTIRIPDFRQPLAVTSVRKGEPCTDCGRIVSIREVRLDRSAVVPASFQGSSRGIAETNLVGAVVYLPLSGASSDKPFVGGVGTPEMKERFGQSSYDIAVRMEDGGARSFQRGDGARYQVGDRVRTTAAGGLEVVIE